MRWAGSCMLGANVGNASKWEVGSAAVRRNTRRTGFFIRVRRGHRGSFYHRGVGDAAVRLGVREGDAGSQYDVRPMGLVHLDHPTGVVVGSRGGRDQACGSETDGVLPLLRPGPEDHVLLRDQLGERCRQLRRPLCAVVRAHQCGSRGGRAANRSSSAFTGAGRRPSGLGTHSSEVPGERGCGVSRTER